MDFEVLCVLRVVREKPIHVTRLNTVRHRGRKFDSKFFFTGGMTEPMRSGLLLK